MSTLLTQPEPLAIEPELSSVAAAEIPHAPRTRWWRVHPIYLLTLLAAALRLTFITQPPLWGDEALTFSRVCADFRDMLDILQHDGFAPLHYELYWVIARVFWLTPVVMRLVPVVAGTLMVPAMYFLARQIVGRPAALITAFFTTISAYMLWYSRDAKMYPHFWLCAVVNAASLLWWLRCWRERSDLMRIAFLCWIAAGVAMVGLDTLGLFVLGIQPLLLVTSRRPRWKQAVLMVIGLAIILSGPAMYYSKFNKLAERTDDSNFERAAGIYWVEFYNRGRSGPNHALYAATTYLTSWTWPRDLDKPQIDPGMQDWMNTACAALLLVIALGVFPWHRRWRASRAVSPEEPWWRSAFWLSVWLVVPAYVFYCKSIPHYASPTDWITAVGELFKQQWLLWGLAILAVIAACFSWRRTATGLATTFIVIALLAIIVAFIDSGLLKPLDSIHTWRAAARNAWVWLAVSAISASVAIWVFTRPRTRANRKRAGLALFGSLLLVLSIFAGWVNADVTLPDAAAQAWDSLTDHRLLLAALVGVPALSFYFAGGTLGSRLKSAAQFATVISGVWLICFLIFKAFDGQQPNGSVWMPRYVGVVWPAFAIAVGALIARLPSRALRWAVIAVLTAVNLRHEYARVMIGSEPPTDRVAADIINSDTPRIEKLPGKVLHWQPLYQRMPDGKFFTSEVRTFANPTAGAVMQTNGRYYLMMLDHRPIKPMEIRTLAPNQFFDLRLNVNVFTIAEQAKKETQLKELIVWDYLPPNQLHQTDRLPTLLANNWGITSEQTFPIHETWEWMNIGEARRRVYVRRPAPPNRPPHKH